ncbi:MAG: PAS domain S-box protein [Anaerolineae bacterium]|nr:PAS domain S-box protein [Anaerolineae bacterium]
MKPNQQDQEHLMAELACLRQRVAELETMLAEHKQLQQRLQESEQMVRALLGTPFHLVGFVNAEGIILDVNEIMARRMGYRVDELVGRYGWDLLPPDLARSRKAYADHVFQSGQPVRFEDERQGIWYDNVFQPVFNGQGRVTKVAVLARDITEHKRMEQELERRVQERTAELAASEARYREAEEQARQAQEETLRVHRLLMALSQAAQAVQQARTRQDVFRLMGEEIRKLGFQAAIFDVAEDHTFLTFHYLTSWRRMQQVTQRLLGLSLLEMRVPLAPDGFFQPIIEGGESRFCQDTAALATRGFPRLGYVAFEKLLTLLRMRHSIYAPLTVAGQTRQLLGVFGDELLEADVPTVTAFANQAAIALENARLLEELAASSAHLRRLAQRVINAQEEERRRLSQALHDEAGQALTALRISLELLRDDLAGEAGASGGRLDDAIALTTQTMEELRLLARDLRPPALDAVSLDQALAGVCQDFVRRTQIAVDYLGAPMPPVSEAVSITLYRFLQEALTNAVRHAHASRVSVTLRCDGRAINLAVEDNGKGFDKKVLLPAAGRSAGLGLLGIQERLEMLGGRLDITSQIGRGTRLVGWVPLQNAGLERGGKR